MVAVVFTMCFAICMNNLSIDSVQLLYPNSPAFFAVFCFVQQRLLLRITNQLLLVEWGRVLRYDG